MPYFPPLVVTGGGGGPTEPTGPTAFVPTDIAGLKVWLDASDDPTIVTAAADPVLFSPASLPNLAFWIDCHPASAGLGSSGGKVTTAINKGLGSGYWTQSDPAKQFSLVTTAYGRAMQNISAGTDFWLSGTSDTVYDIREMTIITVARREGSSFTPSTILSRMDNTTGDGWQHGQYWSDVIVGASCVLDQKDVTTGGSPLSTVSAGSLTGGSNRPFIAVTERGPTEMAACMNGNARVAGNPGSFLTYATPVGAYKVVIGGKHTAGGAVGTFKGEIYEILMFTRAITDAERVDIEGYLAHKWGLVADLPVGHLHKAAAPTVAAPGPNVTTWTNRANPAVDLVQATSSLRPWLVDTSIGKGVRFLSTESLSVLDNGDANLADMTLIGVMTANASPTGGGTVVGCSADDYDGWRLANYVDQDQLDWNDNTGSTYSTVSNATPLDVPFIFCDRQEVPNLPIGNIDSAPDYTGESGGDNYVPPTAVPLTLFVGLGSDFSNCFMGDLHDVLLYDTSLDTSERQKVEGYLAHKWGIQANLPADHTYKTEPPMNYPPGGSPSGPAGGDLQGMYPNPTLAPNAVNTIEIAANAVTKEKMAVPPLGTVLGRAISPYGDDSQYPAYLGPYDLQYIIGTYPINWNNYTAIYAPVAAVPLSVQALTASGESVLLELWRNLTPGGAHTVGNIAWWTKNLSNAKLYAAQIGVSMDVATLGSEQSSMWLSTLTPGVGSQTQLRMSNGVVLGNPTGEYKGVGSINAQNGFYDNGVRLTAGGAQALSFRNALGRNGGMEVWQRGDGGTAVFAVAAGSSPAYTADGWYLYTSSNQACTVWQSPGLNVNSGFCMRVQRNAGQTGTASIKANFPLDTDEIITLRGAIVTLSFTARAGATFGGTGGTLAAVLYTGTSSPGRRGQSPYSGEVVVISGTTVALTTTATRYTFTSAVIVPVNAGQMEVGIGPAGYTGTAGANDYFEVDDIQLEIAAAATPFERRLFGDEIALCRRFYQKSFDYTILPANAQGNFGAWAASQSVPAATVQQMCCVLPVEMRSTFSVSLFNTTAASTQVQNTTTGVACTGTTATASGRRAINIATTTPAGSAVGNLLQVHATCNASL